MKKTALIAGIALMAFAACKKDDDTSTSASNRGTWTVGTTVYNVYGSSTQRGTGELGAFDSSGNRISFSFSDTGISAGTYAIVENSTRGQGPKQVSIEVADPNFTKKYRATGSDGATAIISVSDKGTYVSVMSCRAKRVGGSDSTTLSITAGPLIR